MCQKAAELLKYGQEQLKNAGIFDWDYDSRTLLKWICHISRMDLLINPDLMVKEDTARCYRKYIEKRAAHQPLQYLMGECEFMGLPFWVNPHVLIPRQDTETLVEWILEREKKQTGLHILDVCTGSGCIAVSLAALGNHPYVDAVDLSFNALSTAKKNAERNQVQVSFEQSDMFSQVKGIYDIIVSNPPYIPTEVMKELMPEVREHEPEMALDGKEDGLFFYRILARESRRHFKGKGRLYLEIGYDQGESVPALLQEAGFEEIEVKKDLAGNDRAVAAVFP